MSLCAIPLITKMQINNQLSVIWFIIKIVNNNSSKSEMIKEKIYFVSNNKVLCRVAGNSTSVEHYAYTVEMRRAEEKRLQ